MKIQNIEGNYTIPSNLSLNEIRNGLFIECNTANAPVTVTLPPLDAYPSMPVLRIFVVDATASAATNNITIELPQEAGVTSIDGEQTMTIDDDGDSMIFDRVNEGFWTVSKPPVNVAAIGATLDVIEADVTTAKADIVKVEEDVLALAGVVSVLEPSAPSYKVFTGIVSQSGTDAPTVAVLENTIGEISFSRVGVGEYNITSSGLFTLNKTIVFLSTAITPFSGTAYKAEPYNSNAIGLSSATGSMGDTATDSTLSQTPIEIRVYK